MASPSGLSRHKHLDELDRPIRTGSGWTSAADRRAATLANLGVTSLAAELNILDGVTATFGELNYLDITTLGTGAASKAVVLDSGEDYTWPATGVLTYGVLKDPAGTTVTSLGRELNELDSSAKFVLYEDFFGTWAIGDAGPADRWSTTAGSGANTEVATTVAASINGAVTLKSSSADDTHAANNSALTGINLGWKADSGGLAIEARVKIDAITAVYLFVGFTDVISTTVECPIFMLAADLDSDANDACGVIFDTDATTDMFTVGGTAATVDVTPVVSAVAPVADTYVIIRVEVSAAGAVTGYINGTSIGSVAAAVTPTTALTPAIVIGNRGAAQRIATIDYIKVEQNRV